MARVGPATAACFYMTNKILSTVEALQLGLADVVCHGVNLAQRCAWHVAATLGSIQMLPGPILADTTILAKEAVGHAECRLLNRGEAKAAIDSPVDIAPIVFKTVLCHGKLDRLVQERQLASLFQFASQVKWLRHPTGDRAATTTVHEILHASGMPTIATCDSVANDIFPCTADVVLAHVNATFRSDSMRSVDIVAAQSRLPRSLRERLCKGDLVNALEARRGGMIDLLAHADELRVEYQRLCGAFELIDMSLLTHCMLVLRRSACGSSSLVRDRVVGSSRREQTQLRFAACCGVALIKLIPEPNDLLTTTDAAVDWLSTLGPSLHAIAIIITDCQGASPWLSTKRAMGQMQRTIWALHALGVPIVCSANTEIDGSAVALWLAADYRIADERAVCEKQVATHMPDRIFSKRIFPLDAQRYGLPSKSADAPAGSEERCVRFAAWLAHQPAIGLMHMLALTRTRPCFAPCQSRALTAPALMKLKLLLLAWSRTEMSLELQRQVACTETCVKSIAPLRVERRCFHSSALPILRPNLPVRLAAAAPSQYSQNSAATSGIKGLEVYVPRHCVDAVALEADGGCPSSPTRGLLTVSCADGQLSLNHK